MTYLSNRRVREKENRTLGVEEPGKPETLWSVLKDPLGKLVITLEQLGKPESNRR